MKASRVCSLYLAIVVALVPASSRAGWTDFGGMSGSGIYYSRRDQPSEIPTLSEWGMLIMAMLLLASGTVAVLRKKLVSKYHNLI